MARQIRKKSGTGIYHVITRTDPMITHDHVVQN